MKKSHFLSILYRHNKLSTDHDSQKSSMFKFNAEVDETVTSFQSLY